MREGLEPVLAAVDIENAFHNVPVGDDKKYTVAVADMESGGQAHIIYDVLVFGARSSPTVWGRYAAFLGRALTATFKECRFQIYVDDPLLVFPGVGGQAPEWLAKILVFTKTLGFPLKLSKAHAGLEVKWVGATIKVDNKERTVKVAIPEDKLQKLLTQVNGFLKAPVVGTRALRSFAGSMAFVAGLVPVLRPFLAPLWAVLARGATNDGWSGDVSSRTAGKHGSHQAHRSEPHLDQSFVGRRTWPYGANVLCRLGGRGHGDHHGCLPVGDRRCPIPEGSTH